MTPRDFLESLANEEPAGRVGVVWCGGEVGLMGFVCVGLARIGVRKLDEEVRGRGMRDGQINRQIDRQTDR